MVYFTEVWVLITVTFSICVGFMGSPSVGYERIQSGEHLLVAGKELARYCGVSEFCATLWYVKIWNVLLKCGN